MRGIPPGFVPVAPEGGAPPWNAWSGVALTFDVLLDSAEMTVREAAR